MENFYEELYQYLIERGIDDDEATEVVNYLYEDNIHEYGLITENRGRAFLNVLKAVGYMSGVLKKPGAKKAVKQVVQKVQGTPVQGKLLTKTGKAQNFTGGRTPFTGTDPVPAASSKLPQPKGTPIETPGQLKINFNPAAKPKVVSGPSPTKVQPSAPKPKFGPNAVKPAAKPKVVSDPFPTKVQPPAPKPEFGPNAAKPTLYPKPTELRPGGQTPEPEFKVTQRRSNAGGATVIRRTNANTRVVQPPAPKPEFGQTAKSVKVSDTVKTKSNAQKALTGVGVVGAATGGIGLVSGIVDKANKESAKRNAQRKTKLAQQEAETKAAEAPKPEPTGERSAKVNQEKQEKAKAEAEKVRRSKDQLSAAAKDFDRTFAAARKEGKKEFTWRGKKYNTKLKEEQVPIHPAEAAFNKSTPEERAANTKKYGTPYRPIDTSRRSGDPTAPAWMRGGFKSRDEYNKLDQATKDLLN